MKTPIHLVIGQEATAVGCCAALDAIGPRVLQPPHARRLPGQGRRPEGDAVRDALPRQRLRRVARRLDAPDRQARRHGRHLGDRRRRRADRRRRGARRADERRGPRGRRLPRRRDDRRGRRVREPEFRRAQAAAGRLLLREQLLLGAVAAGDAAAAARDIHKWAAVARGAVGRGRRHERAGRARRGPGARSTRARAGGGPTFIEAPVYRFRAHGGAGDDSQTGYRDEAERGGVGAVRSGRACSATYLDVAERCSTRPASPAWKTRSGARSPRRSTFALASPQSDGSGSVQACTTA